ncbi:hypothetical protein [Lichenicola sp.]
MKIGLSFENQDRADFRGGTPTGSFGEPQAETIRATDSRRIRVVAARP